MRKIIVILTLCLGLIANISAKNTNALAPLNSIINTRVGNVSSGVTEVPIITWGADMNSIYANGDELVTTSSSLFAREGLTIKLRREDNFKKQLERYMSGKTPYLRGTLGMVNMAVDALSKDPRTKPVVIYQLSESAGGDVLVVKNSIKSVKDLRGKTIALQAYGPHVDYLAQILHDAGLTLNDVHLRWVTDITGTDKSPGAALAKNDVDAAMVISPDALALTSGGNIGTGAEGSVRGARILLSTKTANRVIADVYAVRSDYLASHRGDVEKFVHALMIAQEKVKALFKSNSNSHEFKKLLTSSAKILLDSEQATADVKGLYGDAETVDYQGNIKFFKDKNYSRNFNHRNHLIRNAFKEIGLVSGRYALSNVSWDYAQLRKGLLHSNETAEARFNTTQVAAAISKKQKQGTLGQGALFEFQIYFKPNQDSFSSDLYTQQFKKVVDLAQTYGGAVITVEGHSDPLNYLRKKKDGANGITLSRIKQSAKNLSLSRAIAVRDSIIRYAKAKQISLDPSQFATIGHGITQPATGFCGSDPCAPKNETEWRSNMRVVFRIIQIEAETNVFKPL